jgi:hypothetical protein
MSNSKIAIKRVQCQTCLSIAEHKQFLQTLRLSALLSGTPKQVSALIPNAENGLFSRFIFYYRTFYLSEKMSLQAMAAKPSTIISETWIISSSIFTNHCNTHGMGRVLIGGPVSSMFLSLIVIPPVYYGFYRVREKFVTSGSKK